MTENIADASTVEETANAHQHKGTRLILIRHGETLANREFRYIGTRNDALSERGVEQAVALAESMAVFPVAAIYSSPLQRAYQTANTIAQHLALQVQVEDDLREGSFGLWEGMSRAEVLALGKQAEQTLRLWESDPSCAPPAGESFVALQARVVAVVQRLVNRHRDQTIVLVSHVGPIKTLLCYALDAPLSSMFHIFLDPATISVVDWRPTRLLVRLTNGHAHMGWDKARWMHL
jgi:ribonuclease H / adenosylcobalamin/alpha-ribazole phosphatase